MVNQIDRCHQSPSPPHWRYRLFVVTCRRALRPIAVWILIAVIVVTVAIAGLALRRWVWTITDPLRFVSDTQRQCYWAIESSGPEGMLNQYEKMAVQTRDWNIWLDYVPLRLLVMRQWGVYLRGHFPQLEVHSPYQAWQRPYEFSAPLLYFNACMDGIAAISAFFLTRIWVRRGSQFLSNGTLAGTWQGLVAAGLIWLNPANLLSAYAWPTWDSWIVPWYLLAALLCSLDLWFCAGIAIAIGAMLKGQQLAVAPIFILWPLLQGRLGAAMRWCTGLIFGMAIIASPWLLTSIPADQLAVARQTQASLEIEQYPADLFVIPRIWNWGAICWIVGGVAAIVSSNVLPVLWKRLSPRSGTPAEPGANGSNRVALLRGLLLMLAMGWPWLLRQNRSDGGLGLAIALVTTMAAMKLRRSHQRFVLAAFVGGSLLMCIRLFNASSTWWQCGFNFGASRWHWIASGLTDNLPGLLYERYGWSRDPDVTAFTVNAITGLWPAILVTHHLWPTIAIDVSAKSLFNTIFIIVLLLVGLGISSMARRNDRRMLIALTAPWMVFFIFPVEIHGRYALYPAAVSAICIGESIGMALMAVFLMLAATTMILDALLQGGHILAFGEVLSQRYPKLFTAKSAMTLYRAVDRTHPDLAWGMFLALGIFLYFTFRRSDIRIKRPVPPTAETARGN